jgi:hypothetical protein
MDSLRPGGWVKKSRLQDRGDHWKCSIGAIDETFSAVLQIDFGPCGVK